MADHKLPQKSSKAKKSLPTIVVVEDNELNLKLFRDLLNVYHFNVVDTRDGLLAIPLIKETMPDMIIMDIQLRGISGLDIIRNIKKDNAIKHIPVIAVTAFAMKNDPEKIIQSGCEAYVSKPISITNFIETVNHFLKTS